MCNRCRMNTSSISFTVLPSPGICDLANIQVTDWYSVGLQLGLSESTLASIQSDDTHDPNNPQTYATAMFSLFLQSCTYPSYLKVMKALISAGENKAAKKLSKQCGKDDAQGKGMLIQPITGQNGHRSYPYSRHVSP